MNIIPTRRWLLLCANLLLFLLIVGCTTPVIMPPYFDERDPARLRVGNGAYELTLAKTNGAIVAFTDKRTGTQLLKRGHRGCLWAVQYLAATTMAAERIDSCAFAPAGTDPNGEKSFRYHWDPATRQLTLTYEVIAKTDTSIDPPLNLSIDLIVTASRSTWIDFQLDLFNAGDRVISQVALPAQLPIDPTAVQEALLPTVPGLLLNQHFFTTRPHYEARYPSWQGLFADYVALQVGESTLTLYAIQQSELPASAILRFNNSPETIHLSHAFETYIPGSQSTDHWHAPSTPTQWQSPTVRLQVGQPYSATIEGYRRANALDTFDDLRTKLGERYATISASPLLKIEYDQPPRYWQRLLQRVPSPGLLHWVTYWENGAFDEGYPDYLPPRGSDRATLADLFANARALGFLNMPYTNPTWWDDESPTVQRLGAEAVALRDREGNLRYGCFGLSTAAGCTPAIAARDSTHNKGLQPWQWIHGGYPVSPHAPAVQQRIAETVAELTTALGSDLLFEDQLGVGDVHCIAGSNDCRDYSPWAPLPTTYRQGWLDHTARYAHVGLMTEVGYDRMAEHELGFHGSLRLFDQWGEADRWWGQGNWRPYPFATMLLRDKVLFYQHNLAPETFTDNLAALRWNLAMGYQLSYGLNVVEGRGGPDSPWLQVVSLLQHNLLAPHVDQRIRAYKQLAEQVTVTRYGPVRIIANWQQETPFAINAHTIAPNGFYFSDTETGHTAGAYTIYNGMVLPEGIQIIVEVHSPTAIDLYRPIGDVKSIVVQLPPSWPTDAIELTAHTSDDTILATTIIKRADQRVPVPYHAAINGQAVDHYTLTRHE